MMQILTKIIDYIKKYNEIQQIIVFGDIVSETSNIKSYDIAVKIEDVPNKYDILGDILSYMSELTADCQCTLIELSDNLSKYYKDRISTGVVCYEQK